MLVQIQAKYLFVKFIPNWCWIWTYGFLARTFIYYLLLNILSISSLAYSNFAKSKNFLTRIFFLYIVQWNLTTACTGTSSEVLQLENVLASRKCILALGAIIYFDPICSANFIRGYHFTWNSIFVKVHPVVFPSLSFFLLYFAAAMSISSIESFFGGIAS